MNNLAAFRPSVADATSRAKIANVSISAQMAFSLAHSYEKLPILMSDVSARRELAELAESANAIAPVSMFGTISPATPAQISLTYWRGHSFGAHRFDLSDFPSALLAKAIDPVQTPVTRLGAHRALEEMFGCASVARVLTVDLGEVPTKFWIGVTNDDELTASQLARFAALVPSASRVLLKSDGGDDSLKRLEGAAELIGELFNVLDVRTVFGRVSEIARKVLPHDVLGLGTFNEDLSEVTLYACTCQSPVDAPRVTKNQYPLATTLAWDYHVFDDLSADPLERDAETTRAGFRSALRLPIRFGDRLIGGLEFAAAEPNKYTAADVKVGRRIAEYMALALSHHQIADRLAEKVRLAEELRSRTASLELLDDLLATLTDEDELSRVIERVSAITQKVLAHDAMLVPIVMPNGTHVRMLAGTLPGGAIYPGTAEIPPHLQSSAWEYDIIDDALADPIQRNLPSAKLGLRSSLRVAIKSEGKLVAGVIFLSKTPGYYKQSDVMFARRIADRLALGLARESGHQASKRADEADERALRLESRVKTLTEELDSRTGYRRVVGDSDAWRDVLTQATQVAPTDTTALLLGESGTGKEVVARFIHRASSRRNGPFVAINCAALPEQLLEAELFGYERGAFTGATQSKPGQLEQAAGGTLFLDEVAEMAPSSQAKFLRVLQEKEFQRLGGTRVLRTDARIIAATNRDLMQSIERGLFREDLYYRLNVFAIHLPPLRERREDILALSDAFLTEISKGLGRPPAGISREARSRLLEYHWPGNVRELRNVLERAAILCDGGLVLAEHLALPVPAPLMPPSRPLQPLVSADTIGGAPVRSANDLKSMERTMIEKALQDARFNKSKTAAILGLTRAQLYGRMRRYGLD